MNKRLLQIALVIVVIAIWSKLAVDFFKYKESEPNYVVSNNTIHADEESDDSADFTYELGMDYTDPFFKKTRKKKRPNTTRRSPVKKVIVETPMEPVKWPSVSYLGDIANTKGGSKSIILKVEKEEYILHEGGVASSVEVISIYRDSLVLSYMDEQKTIFR